MYSEDEDERCLQDVFIKTNSCWLRTNWVKHNIDKTVLSSLCRLCGTHLETLNHIVGLCKKLPQRNYNLLRDTWQGQYTGNYYENLGLHTNEKWHKKMSQMKFLWGCMYVV